MPRQIISVPEGVYYRGRFRATMAWSKVMKRKGDSDSELADKEAARSTGAPSESLLQGMVSAIAELRNLQVRPTGRRGRREFVW